MKKATGARTQSELADILQIRQGTISDAKKRGQIPSDWLMKLCRSHGINPIYITDGQPPVYIGDPMKLTATSPVDVREALSPFESQIKRDVAQTRKSAADRGKKESSEKTTPRELLYIPQVESRLPSTGESFSVIENETAGFGFPRKWLEKTTSAPGNTLLIEEAGDGMYPTIQPGDILMLDTGRTRIRNGCIHALNVGGGVLVKRLEWLTDERIRVISDNRDVYPPYETRLSDIRVLGRIVWHARRLRERA